MYEEPTAKQNPREPTQLESAIDRLENALGRIEASIQDASLRLCATGDAGRKQGEDAAQGLMARLEIATSRGEGLADQLATLFNIV